MILWRPVYQRASLMAFSFASAPPFVKNDIDKSPGVTSASSFPSRERDSVAIGGPIVASFSAPCFVAWVVFGGACALPTFASCAGQYRVGVPAEMHKLR